MNRVKKTPLEAVDLPQKKGGKTIFSATGRRRICRFSPVCPKPCFSWRFATQYISKSCFTFKFRPSIIHPFLLFVFSVICESDLAPDLVMSHTTYNAENPFEEDSGIRVEQVNAFLALKVPCDHTFYIQCALHLSTRLNFLISELLCAIFASKSRSISTSPSVKASTKVTLHLLHLFFALLNSSLVSFSIR